MKPCNDLIVHRRRDGFSQTRSSPSVWRQFRSPPSRSQTRLACIHVSSHRTCEPPSCACVAPSSYPASLIVSAMWPSVLPAPQEVDARGGRGFADLLYSRTNSARTAASQDFALHDEIGSRAWWLLLVGLLARCCCCCWSGRCCRCRCGRRGAASRCWLVQLGAMGAWVAVGGAARPRSAMRAATARPPAYTTKRVTGASGRARGRTAV